MDRTGPRTNRKLVLTIAAITLFSMTSTLALPSSAESTGGNVAECAVCHPSTGGGQGSSVVTGSEACLSCHDGSIAGLVAHNSVGMDLRNPSMNHPVGIDYKLASFRTEELNTEDATSARTRVSPGDLLVEGRVECSSCHDYHHNGTYAANLRVSNDGSQLCLTCHDK